MDEITDTHLYPHGRSLCDGRARELVERDRLLHQRVNQINPLAAG